LLNPIDTTISFFGRCCLMMSDVFAGPTSEICSASWYEEGVAPSHSIWWVPEISNCVWMFGYTYETMYLICVYIFGCMYICMYVCIYVCVCMCGCTTHPSQLYLSRYIHTLKGCPNNVWNNHVTSHIWLTVVEFMTDIFASQHVGHQSPSLQLVNFITDIFASLASWMPTSHLAKPRLQIGFV